MTLWFIGDDISILAQSSGWVETNSSLLVSMR